MTKVRVKVLLVPASKMPDRFDNGCYRLWLRSRAFKGAVELTMNESGQRNYFVNMDVLGDVRKFVCR